MFLSRWLERIGLIQPRYRKGWPRGVRPVFPEGGAIKKHITANNPQLWDAMCKVPIFDGLMMAQQAGLISGVAPGAGLSNVTLVQPPANDNKR